MSGITRLQSFRAGCAPSSTIELVVVVADRLKMIVAVNGQGSHRGPIWTSDSALFLQSLSLFFLLFCLFSPVVGDCRSSGIRLDPCACPPQHVPQHRSRRQQTPNDPDDDRTQSLLSTNTSALSPGRTVRARPRRGWRDSVGLQFLGHSRRSAGTQLTFDIATDQY